MEVEKKKSQLTEMQKKSLIEYMKKNADLQSGTFSNNFSYKDAQRKWNEIGELLNSMPGPTKDWKNWRKTWQDLKSRTKTKISSVKKHAQGTGGGLPLNDHLTKTEEDIMNIVKEVCIDGQKETKESIVHFEFPEDGNTSMARGVVLGNDGNLEPVLSPMDTIENLGILNSSEIYKDSTEQYLKTSKSKEICCIVETPKASKSKEIPRSAARLKHTLQVVKDFNENMNKRDKSRETYCEEKINCLKRIATALEKGNEHLSNLESVNERIAISLETLSDMLT